MVNINKSGFTRNTQHDESDCESFTSEFSFTDEYDLIAKFKNMPVVALYCEKMSNSLDSLLDSIQISESEWTAWLFQICAGLMQLQSWLNLTHNDLHTNNILWKPTDLEYIYYLDAKGQNWKVPTYGRIFQIIDYGRAIFTVQNKQVISSDYYDGHDAAGQYNFGAIQDPELDYVPPNKSFDLCRLACSIIHSIFPTYPKGKSNAAIITKEGSWVVRETESLLFNLLWTWLRDDSKETVFETEDGDEKYPGFELYSVIASSVHGAIPSDQINKKIFSEFKEAVANSTVKRIVIP